MIRIEEFKVKNYKNIGEADLKLSNFNLIVGVNNSGKTNFIQTLSFLDFLINGAIDEVEEGMQSGYFGFTFKGVYPPNNGNTEFYLKFFDTEFENIYEYGLSIKWENKKGRIKGKIESEYFHYKNIHKTGKATTIFDRDIYKINKLFDDYKKAIKISYVKEYQSIFRIIKVIPVDNQILNKAINSFDNVLKSPTFFFSSFELSKLRAFQMEDAYYGNRLMSFDLEKNIAEIQDTPDWTFFKNTLRNLLDIEYVQVIRDENHKPVQGDIVCRVKHHNQTKYIKRLSDGALLLIALLTKILTSKRDIFLIEKPENSLHPTALLGLLDVMASFHKEKQFIITTHSETLVSRAKPEEVIVAKIGESGMSEISNIRNVRELKRKLRNDFINFSDYVFFGEDETVEIEY